MSKILPMITNELSKMLKWMSWSWYDCFGCLPTRRLMSAKLMHHFIVEIQMWICDRVLDNDVMFWWHMHDSAHPHPHTHAIISIREFNEWTEFWFLYLEITGNIGVLNGERFHHTLRVPVLDFIDHERMLVGIHDMRLFIHPQFSTLHITVVDVGRNMQCKTHRWAWIVTNLLALFTIWNHRKLKRHQQYSYHRRTLYGFENLLFGSDKDQRMR